MVKGASRAFSRAVPHLRVNQASARKLVYASELADLPKQSND